MTAAAKHVAALSRSPSPAFWAGKSVFLTGHTGFKGSWLSVWLHQLGAKLHGYSLAPPTMPSLFEQAGISAQFAASRIADICEKATLSSELRAAEPDIV
ncbi:MAG: CDP-glucose 4,6-dehydratase, partial [Betaproteobacteria bacterium]|nr:CDP-glucose 4,6-dehydratase [Betaproteobacteria bacterium]